MKKIILATVLAMFGVTAGLGVSAARACDGMKGHEKADKGDSTSSTAKADKSAKSGGAKADQKS